MYIKNMCKKAGVSFLCLIALLSSGYALAQSPVNSGALLRQDERLNKPPAPSLPARDAENQQAEIQDINGETIFVRELRFIGAVELLAGSDIAAKIDKLVAESVNQQYDFNGLQMLADRVTSLLKNDGWILARAYLPHQDVSNGVVTIAILGGQLDSQGSGFIIEQAEDSPLRIDTARLERTAAEYLLAGTAVRERDLERALLLINDLPEMTARARLEAGEDPESTRVHILAEEGSLFTGRLQMNNFGNRFTGRDQAQAELNVNDPTRRGDQFTASLTLSEGLTLGRINYGLPLGYRGWHGSLAYTLLDYKVVAGQASEQADYSGDASTFEVGLRYPIIRSSDRNIWLRMGYRSDRFEDRFNGSTIGDKRIHSSQLSMYGDVIDNWYGGGRSDWSLQWVHGNLNLSRLPQQEQNDRNAFDTAGTFNKLEYALSRHQYLTTDLSVHVGLNGQLASNNLDSSQKFFPGGPNGVRAYPGGEAPADEGQLLRAELRYRLNYIPQHIGALQLQLFYDHAWVKLSNSAPGNVPITNAENANQYRLAAAGVGLNLVKDQKYGVSVNWARKVGHNPGRDAATGFDSDEQSNTHRFWLQGVVWF